MMTKEQKSAYNKARYAANREKLLAQSKTWKAANREKVSASTRAYYEANKEEKLAKQRVYDAARPNEMLAYKHKHRAKEAGVKIGDEKAILAWLKSWRTEAPVACHYCKAVKPGTDLTVDHVVPMSAGGPHDLTNLVVCCSSCNSSKKDQLPEVWRNLQLD